MIHEFSKSRFIRFPKKWANSVSRWIAGVHSPSGSIRITNTLDPSRDGSVALDVDLDSLIPDIANRMNVRAITRDEIERVKMIVRGFVDGLTIRMNGGHLSVSEEWVGDAIDAKIREALSSIDIPQPENPQSATSIESGTAPAVGQGSSACMEDTKSFTAKNNGGATLAFVTRAYSNGMDVTLFWRTLTISEDGRIVSIGAETFAKNVAEA